MKKYFYDDFKESYYKELERKENYNSKIGVLLTIYSLVSVPLLYCLNNAAKINICNVATISTFILIAISIVFYLISILYALKAYWGHKYVYLPTPQKLDAFILDRSKRYDDYKEYFEYYNISKENYINEEKEEVMYNYYKDATTHNIKENDAKMKRINICSYYLAISVVLMLIACALLKFVFITEEPTSVYIENETILTQEVNNIMSNEEARDNNAVEQTQQQPPSPPPPASAPPEMRVINENFSLDDIKANNDDKE